MGLGDPEGVSETSLPWVIRGNSREEPSGALRRFRAREDVRPLDVSTAPPCSVDGWVPSIPSLPDSRWSLPRPSTVPEVREGSRVVFTPIPPRLWCRSGITFVIPSQTPAHGWNVSLQTSYLSSLRPYKGFGHDFGSWFSFFSFPPV